jgi:MOSC domain-containing protein YiiM
MNEQDVGEPQDSSTFPVEQVVAVGKILAVHVGRPTELQTGRKRVLSAINKQLVHGPVMVRRLNIDGDEQADLSVHGGPDKALYCYPAEHYEAWNAELELPIAYGFFGENLTVAGLAETDLHIGAVLLAGEAVLQVSQPRLPCFKLGMKFGSQHFVRQFLNSGRSGFYCRVLKEGLIESGQTIEIVDRAEGNLTVSESLASAIG